MLNKSELYEVVKFLRNCSIVGPLPCQVDLKNWELKKAGTRKERICGISYSFFLLHGLYKVCGLAYAFLAAKDVKLHQLMVHAIIAMGSTVWAFWYYKAYIADPELFATYVKVTLGGNIGGPPLQLNQLKKSWTSRLKEYSLQDWIATSLPSMTTLAIVLISASYMADPSMSLLLYAAIPQHLQTWTTFGLCMMEEIRFLVNVVTIATPIFQLQVISLDLVASKLKLQTQMVQSGTQGPGTLRSLRSFQLYVLLLNDVNKYLIFTWKLASLSVSIAAIAHFHEYPVFGVMYYVLLLDATLIYTVTYGKAFTIPDLFDKGAGCALLRMHGDLARCYKRQILSIPRSGVKVGHFHKMERASTVIFVDYVSRNVVSMLIAYG